MLTVALCFLTEKKQAERIEKEFACNRKIQSLLEKTYGWGNEYAFTITQSNYYWNYISNQKDYLPLGPRTKKSRLFKVFAQELHKANG